MTTPSHSRWSLQFSATSDGKVYACTRRKSAGSYLYITWQQRRWRL